VVVDGTMVTAQGPALAIAFALTLVEILCGTTCRDEVAQGMVVYS
jgi:4-methyl-5(b-hydroxyethyl)-thiazole monophosphate biosynthesis